MDDGLLIEQVSHFSFLYDKSDPRFKNKNAKENAWRTIGEILEAEAITCEQKWAVLRAKYTNIKRDIRNIPSGSAGGSCSASRWCYYDQMGFLDPFLTTRRTSSNYPSDSHSSSVSTSKTTHKAWDTYNEIIMDTETAVEECVTDEDSISNSVTLDESINDDVKNKKTDRTIKEAIPRHTNPKTKKRAPQEVLLEKMGDCFTNFSKKIKGEGPEAADSQDFHFAKSLANDMGFLSPKQKVQFKRKVYECLKEFMD